MTPEDIETLEPHQLFVFGSNLNGAHAGGAAAKAFKDFGALWSVSVGPQGQSYAIATLDGNMQELALEDISDQIQDMFIIARANPHKQFLVTRIGTGIAGFD